MPFQVPAYSRGVFACAQKGDEMSETPFMQLYVSDFIGDTLALSTEQVGAYLLALMAMWNAGGELPDDDRKLARITRLSVKKWLAARPDIEPFFTVSGGTWRSERLTKELQKARSKSESRAYAGAKGVEAKALKSKKPDVANASDLLCHSPEPEPYIYSEPKGSSSYAHSGEQENTSNSPIPKPKNDEAAEAIHVYNETAKDVGWPLAQKLTKPREAGLKARLRDAGGLEGWRVAMDKAKASPFLRGETGSDRNWRPDLDFFLQAKSFTRLMEGGYDGRANTNGKSGRISQGEENLLRAFAGAANHASGGNAGDQAGQLWGADDFGRGAGLLIEGNR